MPDCSHLQANLPLGQGTEPQAERQCVNVGSKVTWAVTEGGGDSDKQPTSRSEPSAVLLQEHQECP